MIVAISVSTCVAGKIKSSSDRKSRTKAAAEGGCVACLYCYLRGSDTFFSVYKPLHECGEKLQDAPPIFMPMRCETLGTQLEPSRIRGRGHPRDHSSQYFIHSHGFCNNLHFINIYCFI